MIRLCLALFFALGCLALGGQDDPEALRQGISIEVAISKEWGPGRPIVRLHNHTDRPLRFLSHGITSAWRVRIYNAEGKQIAAEGFELFKQGSSATVTIEPGKTHASKLDLRWGVLRDKNIPDLCRVEIETPPFMGEEDKLTSARIVVPMRLLDEGPEEE